MKHSFNQALVLGFLAVLLVACEKKPVPHPRSEANTIKTGPGPGEKVCIICNGSGRVKCTGSECENGKIPCPGPCLKLSQGDWVHLNDPTHPPTDLWKVFYKPDGSFCTAFTQAHVGHVIVPQNDTFVDSGPCKQCGGRGKINCNVCNGTGFVTCKFCEGKKYIPASWSLDHNDRFSNLSIDDVSQRVRDALQSLDFETARLLTEICLKQNPNNATAHHLRAAYFFGSQQFDSAFKECTTAIKLDPKLYSAFRARASIYFLKSDYQNAVKDCTEAILLAPKDAAAWRCRAKGYFNLENFNRALSDLDEVIRLGSPTAEDYLLRASTHLQFKQYSMAVEDASTAYRMNPALAQALSCRACAYSKSGQYDLGAKDSELAIATAPNDASVQNDSAWFYATCPQKEFRNGAKAVELAMAAAKSTKFEDASVLDTLAVSFAEAGKFDDAVNYEKRALSLSKTLKSKSAIKEIESRLAMFREKTPYHEKAE